MDLWVIFLTGLTTGGLTCLAVQGGLLAAAITKQVVVEQPHHKVSGKRAKAKQAEMRRLTGIQLSQNLLPVLAFLIAKLAAHTALGFLLGALGSVMQISREVQAAMQIAAGVFMLATALNMLNVHPIFRYFVIQPPRVLTRLVRNQAKSQDVFAPALLGLMTVFIPCGTTQAMEILAISSANPVSGAAIMFAFVLGTAPTFLGLGFVATQIRGKFQSIFATVTAYLVLFLGIVSIDSALVLLDSPLAPRRVIASVIDPYAALAPAQPQVVEGVQEIRINALNNGYAPNYWTAESGVPIRLHMVTNDTLACTLSFIIPSLGIQQVLPVTGEIVIDIPAQPPGDLNFTCSMGMYTGVIRIS